MSPSCCCLRFKICFFSFGWFKLYVQVRSSLFCCLVGGERSRPRFYEPFVSSTYTPVRSRTADPTCIQYVSKRIFISQGAIIYPSRLFRKKKLNYPTFSMERNTLIIIIIFLWPRCWWKTMFFSFNWIRIDIPSSLSNQKESIRMSSHARKKSLSHAHNDRCKWG